jgi:hypothetical protein
MIERCGELSTTSRRGSCDARSVPRQEPRSQGTISLWITDRLLKVFGERAGLPARSRHGQVAPGGSEPTGPP